MNRIGCVLVLAVLVGCEEETRPPKAKLSLQQNYRVELSRHLRGLGVDEPPTVRKAIIARLSPVSLAETLAKDEALSTFLTKDRLVFSEIRPDGGSAILFSMATSPEVQLDGPRTPWEIALLTTTINDRLETALERAVVPIALAVAKSPEKPAAPDQPPAGGGQ